MQLFVALESSDNKSGSDSDLAREMDNCRFGEVGFAKSLGACPAGSIRFLKMRHEHDGDPKFLSRSLQALDDLSAVRLRQLS